MKSRTLVISFIVMIPLCALAIFYASGNAASTGYGTYLGGELTEKGYHLAVDETGRAYITGYTTSTDFPTNTRKIPRAHGVDVFTTRFSPEGNAVDFVLWFNALSAADEDYGYGIALGPDQSSYIVGQTQSADFCQVFGAVPGIDQTYNGSVDGFLVKVKPDGSGLDYCTYLGGSELDNAWAVAVDPAGFVYVTGGTWSTDFITGATTVQDQHYGLRDAYLLRINPAGTEVLHSSYIGGTNQEEARGIAVNEQGVATITGWTRSTDFITTTGVVGSGFGGGFDAFVTQIDTVSPALLFSTYLGGADEDRGYGLAGDSAGNLFVAGLTRSDDFPVIAGGFMTTTGGEKDGFVVKMNSTGTILEYGTYLGGTEDDLVNDITLDPAGNVFVTGETHSPSFPTTATALSPTLPGPSSGFVSILNNAGSNLLYSSFLGGSQEDEGHSIVLGPAGKIYLAGATRSADFPVTAGAYDVTHNGDYDVFITTQEIPISAPALIYLPLLHNQ